MLNGTLALLERSLRMDARTLAPHLVRFGLMIGIYAALIITFQTSLMLGAPGLHFFRNMAYVNLVLMTLLGIGFFSTAITEEKEDDTLGLMLMSNIDSLGVLLGISGGRLVQCLLLLAIQYPFVLLAITFGGITPTQIHSTCAALLSYAIMLAGIGLLCSTVFRRNRSASVAMIVGIATYWVVPLACNSILARSVSLSPALESILNSTAKSCVFTQMSRILATGLRESAWSDQVISNLSIGASSFFLAWALFGVCNRDPASGTTPRGLGPRSGRSHRLFSPGSPRHNAIAWKDFHFVAGGRFGVLIRWGFYPLMFLVAIFYSKGFFGGILASGTTKAITATYLNFMIIALAIDAGLLISRSLREEVRAKAFPTLKLLPTSIGTVLYSKFLGSLLIGLPGVIFLVAGIIGLPYGPSLVGSFFYHPGAYLYVAHLILIPHAAAVVATFFDWASLPLGICVAVCSLVLMFSTIITFQPGQFSPSVAALTVMAACAFCHFLVWKRVEALSAT